MNYKITVTKQGQAWAWDAYSGQSHIAGGYCKTKRHALSDASIWIKANSPERKESLEYTNDGNRKG